MVVNFAPERFPIITTRVKHLIYHFASPLGSMAYDWDGEVCQQVWLEKQSDITHDDPVSRWLLAYFKGNLLGLPPLPEANTPFQDKLRLGLLSIPFGEIRTYGELATTLNTSPRGLGQALGANMLPVLIPCHRVISANGLGGFAFGTTWKKKLLNFEKT